VLAAQAPLHGQQPERWMATARPHLTERVAIADQQQHRPYRYALAAVCGRIIRSPRPRLCGASFGRTRTQLK
jgi:hypothetical protein